jgi:hypothetical protein
VNHHASSRFVIAAALMVIATPAHAWNTSGIPTLLVGLASAVMVFVLGAFSGWRRQRFWTSLLWSVGAMIVPVVLSLMWARDKSGLVEFFEMLAATVLFGSIPLAICFALFYWVARGLRHAFSRRAAPTNTQISNT